MSLISKNHLSLTLQSIKKLLSGKADKSELQEEISKVSENIVQSDWNQNDETQLDYVKNRPFCSNKIWEVVHEEQEIVFDNDIPVIDGFSSGDFYSYPNILSGDYPEGTECKVVIDGEEHSATIKKINGNFYIGNGALLRDNYSNLPDTGESFLVYSFQVDGVSVVTNKPVGTYKVSLSVFKETIHKLDEKYIPDTIARTDDVNSDITELDQKLTQRAGIVYLGWCDTDAATSAKVVKLNHSGENFKLKVGAIVNVRFTYTNTASPATLNVASTGAKSIRLLGSTSLTSNYWQPNSRVTFVYGGSDWNIISISPSAASTTYYGLTKLSSSYTSSSNTTAATSGAVRSAYNRGNDAYNLANAALPKSGGTMTGDLTLKGNPTSNLHAATKAYVDNKIVQVNNNIVQPDWNQMSETAPAYIKNKTHYAIGGEVILEEQTFTSVPTDVDIHPMNPEYTADTATNIGIPASVGDLYDVYFNGVMYSCTVKSNYVFNCIGNESLCSEFVNKESTGEPFLVSLSKKIRVYTAEPMEFTIKIVKHEFFKALDEKFIPDTIARTEDIENYVVDLVGDTKVSEQINNAVSQKSQVQIITWGDDD